MENKKIEIRDKVLKALPISISLGELVGTGVQQISTHFDAVIAVDVHLTLVPPAVSPIPLPHPFAGIIFDPIDYINVEIPVHSSLQAIGLPPSIPLGGTVFVNGEHKATTTTSVIGVAVFGKHITDLPAYNIINKPGAPHDGEVYIGAETVFAQGAELSGDKLQHILTCNCPPMGHLPLPTIPERYSKNPLICFALYNNLASSYIQIPGGNPVIVGGNFVTHKYTLEEYLMRFAAMGLMKVAGGLLKNFNRHILKNVLGNPNPLSKVLCFLGFDPVNIITGGLLFEWEDFEIGGNTPIKWENTYYSNYQLPMGSFGKKNFNSWDLMLIPDLENNAVAWVNPLENIAMSIPWVEVGEEPFYYRPYKIRYYRPEENLWILEQDLNVYYYKKIIHPTEGVLFKCFRIRYDDGTEFTLSYQGINYILHQITSNDGRVILCEADKKVEKIEQVYYIKDNLKELQVRYNYDENDNITHIWDRKNKVIHLEYNTKNLIIKRTNRNGMQYVFEYDDKNRVIYTSGIDNFQAAKINYYPEQGYNEVIYLAHTNKKEFYYYDENFLVYKKVDAEGGETWYDYTANLERQLISSPNGKTIGYKFDELGNISEMIHPDGSSISYKYNNDGQITNRIDAKGNVEFWQYDNTKRLIKYLNPLGDELTYNYIDDNRLPNSLYKNGKLISEYQYNAANQLTLSTKSDSIIQQWRYDAYGRLSYFNPKESITIGLKRDTLGRVATFSQSQKSDIQISYDAYDLPIKIADNKLQMEFDYTPMGSLKNS